MRSRASGLRSNSGNVPACCVGSATMPDPADALRLAERVAEAARSLGLESALIGAAALAVHRYTRGTEDIDLAVAVDPQRQLLALERELSARGLATRIRMPDDEDPLGGVLSVWGGCGDGADGDSADLVEVVNFFNPWRTTRSPARDAIRRALPLPGSPLRCVTLEDLVALKLYAGGLNDHADIVQLLARNPNADLERVRGTAASFDRDQVLERLIEQATALAKGLARQRDPG
jgi:hypothetical protein